MQINLLHFTAYIFLHGSCLKSLTFSTGWRIILTLQYVEPSFSESTKAHPFSYVLAQCLNKWTKLVWLVQGVFKLLSINLSFLLVNRYYLPISIAISIYTNKLKWKRKRREKHPSTVLRKMTLHSLTTSIFSAGMFQMPQTQKHIYTHKYKYMLADALKYLIFKSPNISIGPKTLTSARL